MQDSTKKPMNNCAKNKDGLNQHADLRSAFAGAVGLRLCCIATPRISLAQLTSTRKEQLNYE